MAAFPAPACRAFTFRRYAADVKAERRRQDTVTHASGAEK